MEFYEEFKKEAISLFARGVIRRKMIKPAEDCMMINLLRLKPYKKTNFQAHMARVKVF